MKMKKVWPYVLAGAAAATAVAAVYFYAKKKKEETLLFSQDFEEFLPDEAADEKGQNDD